MAREISSLSDVTISSVSDQIAEVQTCPRRVEQRAAGHVRVEGVGRMNPREARLLRERLIAAGHSRVYLTRRTADASYGAAVKTPFAKADAMEEVR